MFEPYSRRIIGPLTPFLYRRHAAISTATEVLLLVPAGKGFGDFAISHVDHDLTIGYLDPKGRVVIPTEAVPAGQTSTRHRFHDCGYGW